MHKFNSQMNTLFTAFGSGCCSARNFDKSVIMGTIILVSVFVCALMVNVNAELRNAVVRVLSILVAVIIISVKMKDSIIRQR